MADITGVSEMGHHCEDRHCGHCDKTTRQEGCNSDHERDSSADYWTCLECKWVYSGLTGKYSPPWWESQVVIQTGPSWAITAANWPPTREG